MTSRSQVLDTPEGPLHFTIAHRPRITRRMHLEIDDAGALRVVVPKDWPDFYTRRLVGKHLGKVRRFLDRARTQALEPLQYVDGARHLFRGEEITVRFPDADRASPASAEWSSTESSTLLLPAAAQDPDQRRLRLRAWYRAQAETLFSKRLAYWRRRAPWTQDRRLTLRLRRMRSTWGTCSQSGVIRLNTHLVKAPPDSLDYVIAHELCHVQEMNHGPAFYALQTRLFPDWAGERKHLHNFGSRYVQE